MVITENKPVVSTFEVPEEPQKPNALDQLTHYVYRYRSNAFNAQKSGMTRAEAAQTAAILIRTLLMPTLNGGHVARAFELAKRAK